MSWLSRRLDHLGSASFGAVGGLGLSQAPAFVQAYLQRLGGHIDEARRTVEGMQRGELLPWLDDTARSLGAAELSLRLQELEALRERLLEVPAWWRPARLLQQADWSIARRAAEDFVPAVPLDPASLIWTGVGVIVAALAWETCKIPAWYTQRRDARVASSAELDAKATRSRKPRQT
jgi:hypothetical protein